MSPYTKPNNINSSRNTVGDPSSVLLTVPQQPVAAKCIYNKLYLYSTFLTK